MTVIYARSPYTLDPGVPIAEEPPPAVGLTSEEAEEVQEMVEVHDEEMAGPVTLQTTGEDPEVTAVIAVEAEGTPTRVFLDWGDGESADLTDADPYEQTRIVPPQWSSTITAFVTHEGRDYVVAKHRENNELEPEAPDGP